MYEQLVDTLADLHNIDAGEAGLSDFGKAGNYFERQVMRWTRQYRDFETDYLPEMERLISFLPETIPQQSRTADRPWRLPDRQCAVRWRRNADGRARLGVGDARRSARRFLLSRDAMGDARGRRRRACRNRAWSPRNSDARGNRPALFGANRRRGRRQARLVFRLQSLPARRDRPGHQEARDRRDREPRQCRRNGEARADACAGSLALRASRREPRSGRAGPGSR